MVVGGIPFLVSCWTQRLFFPDSWLRFSLGHLPSGFLHMAVDFIKTKMGEPSNHTENPLTVQQNHGSETTSPAGAGSQTQVSWKGVGGTALSSRFWVWRYRISSVFLYCLYLLIWHIWVLIFLLICMHFGSLRKLVFPYNIVSSSPKLKILNIFKDHLHPSCTLGST